MEQQRGLKSCDEPVQCRESLVRWVVAVAHTARRGVGEQHVDAAAVTDLAQTGPAGQ
jgi:hypothetical protein